MNNYNRLNNINVVRSEFIKVLNSEVKEVIASGTYAPLSTLEINRLFNKYQSQRVTARVFIKLYLQKH